MENDRSPGGAAESRGLVYGVLKNKVLCILLFSDKRLYRSLVLCRPSPGLLFIISLKPALTRRPTELSPLKPGLRIRLAALAVLGRRNGCRRGEECPLSMVKNLPAADGEEQLAL